ncbi:conserved hypothetical protein [uncultured Desulfatiglans sp.]|nr:conserved hypothetical protein [uncultured Desulfatiglans sp.]
MKKTGKLEIHSHDLRILKPVHRSIRRIKRDHSPTVHGFRIWKSSWMLIDFIQHQHLPGGLNILDVGCGWGLAGIYCAKNLAAKVTCMDIDAEVFPFLEIQAQANDVDITTLRLGIGDLTQSDLQDFDLVMGADICFWDELVSPWHKLIRRANRTEKTAVILADPGRTPFDKLERRCITDYNQEAVSWEISDPFSYRGRILKIN